MIQQRPVDVLLARPAAALRAADPLCWGFSAPRKGWVFFREAAAFAVSPSAAERPLTLRCSRPGRSRLCSL